MKSLENFWPPVEMLKQLASSCDEVESRLKAGGSPNLDSIVNRFPEQFRAAARLELQAFVDEWKGETRPSSPQSAETPMSSGSGRFQILDKLGEGGMGRVTIAWDRDLERRVALKEIRSSEVDDERYQRRFQQESRITARLEHPGIVPIYARGMLGEDRPFYAMRLVAGGNSSTMQQVIDQLHQPTLDLLEFKRKQRELVRRLIDVCNTIAYAHSQGICHRDLKPDNILFGPFGETLVVDWGLAYQFQHLDSPSSSELRSQEPEASDSSQQPGDRSEEQEDRRSPVGTRSYAAPECQLPLPISNWQALDVFSLGAILYCILTGRSPWESPAPRQLNPHLSRSLEAICLKAMSSEVNGRYTSSLDMAADLENYLVGDPVSVLAEPWWERSYRWMGRNRVLVTAAGLILCGLLSVLLTFAGLQAQHNRELTQRNVELLAARDRELQQRLSAQRAERLADEKSTIARRHEQRAIDAMRSFTDTLGNDQVMKLSPELQGLRRELLQKPLKVYEQLNAELSSTLETSLYAQEQLAVVAAQLAQLSSLANESSAAKQWNDKAIEHYHQLLKQVEKPLTSDSLTTDQKREQVARGHLGLADSYHQKAILVSQENRTLEAAQHLIQARTLYDQVADDPQWRLIKLRGRSTVLATLAVIQAQLHDLTALTQTFEQAIQDRRAIVALLRSAQAPDSADHDQQLLKAEDDLADLMQDQANVYLFKRLGDRSASYQQFESYIDKLRDRLAQGNDNENVCLKLSWALANYGSHLRLDGELSRAISILEDAVAMRNDLMHRFPSILVYQLNASQTLLELGQTLRSSGQLQQALGRYDQAIDLLRQVSRSLARGDGNRVSLAFALHDLGHLQQELFRDESALASFEESFQILSEADLWKSTNMDVIRLLVDVLDHESFRLMSRGEWSTAQANYQQLWQLVMRSQSVAPTLISPEQREHLWRHWQLCCQRSGDLQTLMDLRQTAAELERADGAGDNRRRTWDELLSHDRTWSGYTELPAGLLHELATRAAQKGDFGQAVELLRLIIDRSSEEQQPIPNSASAATPARWETLVTAAAAVLQLPGEEAQQLASRRQALAWLQQGVTLIERQLDETRAAENNSGTHRPPAQTSVAHRIVNRVWEQTLRNPVFVPVLRSKSQELLTNEERQSWTEVWERIRKLTSTPTVN